MEKLEVILALALAVTVVSSCGLFKKYESSYQAPEGLFLEDDMVISHPDTLSLASLSWREFFTDPELQKLIDTALVRNFDIKLASLRVRETEAALKSAKLGYLPTLSFGPAMNLLPDRNYSVPLSLDWRVDGFGSITNKLREARTLNIQAQDNLEGVQSRIVANIASIYLQMQMLDRQLEIIDATELLWKEILETQKALFENGKSYSTAVNQMEASLIGIQVKKIEIDHEIERLEDSICLLLGHVHEKVHVSIERSAWNSYILPDRFSTGLPASLLENRPDIRAAMRDVEAAYYVSNQALAAMLPGLSLTGLAGWAGGGQTITDPGSFIYGAAISLFQPLFAQGKLRANRKIAQLRQEEATEIYVQKVLEAGEEVNDALHSCHISKCKDVLLKRQVSVLDDAHSATVELMRGGKASYIEVLVAQNNLLDAQLSEVLNLYNGTISLITLYIALGGGVN